MGTAVLVGSSFWVSSYKHAQDFQGQCKSNGVTAFCFHHSRSKFSLLHFRPAVSIGAQVSLTKQEFQGASWSARPRQRLKNKGFTIIAYGVDRLGLDPVVDENASQEDVSVSQITQGSIDTRSSLDSSERITSTEEPDEEGALELVDTDGITFEEIQDNDGNYLNGMLCQPRNYLDEDLDNWQMFAAEEGAGATATAGAMDYETDHSSTADETGSDSEMEDGPSHNLVRRRKAEDVLPFPDSASMYWTAADKEKLKSLQNYRHKYDGKGGLLIVEAMRSKHMNDTEDLLVDSFAELMGGLLTYRPLLALTVKQYMRERYTTLPHSVTLVGLYAPVEGVPVADGSSTMQQGRWIVAGTVELSFSVAGHPDVPTPAPPPNSPYICNMAIKQEYRRRGLGRQMLKAAEDLALRMGCEDMYLHVRIIDTAPLTMYKEAGYQVLSTDSLLSVLTFQRRRHLMRKRLSRAKLVPE